MAAYTSQYFGGVPTVSVATFGDLPAIGVSEQRIIVTGEWTTFSVSAPVIICWDSTNEEWQLESAKATYLKIADAEFASGVWTGTGGSIPTKPGAILVDTTYNESWVWNSTSNIFVPSYLGLATVDSQQKIKGDSATPAGWSFTTELGSTVVTDGSKLVFTATSSSGNSSNNRIFFTDTAGTGTTNNFYMKCLFQRTTFTRATTGALDIFIRHDTGNGGSIVEFADANTSTASTFNGRFANRTTGAGTGYTATANRGDTGWQSETLVQFRVIAGATNALNIAQVKIGTSGWHDISVGTCRTGAGSLRFEFGVTSNNNPSNIAQGKVRYLQAVRYT